MARKYAFKDYNPEKMARVYGSDLSISSKHAIEICTKLNSKTLNQAKDILNDVINMKKPIEFRRFSHGAGHKKGMAAGKFPVKASKEVLKLVESLEANAQQKGLNTAALVLVHTCANRASSPMHYGRRSGRAMKRSHVEMVAEEREIQKPKAKAKPKTEKKEEPKPEVKPVQKPEPKLEQPKVEKKVEDKKVEEPKPEPKLEQQPKTEKKEAPKVEKKEEPKAVKQESQSPEQEVKAE